MYGYYEEKFHVNHLCEWKGNPLTPMSDQENISPYNINTISCIEVMRIK